MVQRLCEFQAHMWCKFDDERIKLCLWSTINHVVIDVLVLDGVKRIVIVHVYRIICMFYVCVRSYNKIKHHIMIISLTTVVNPHAQHSHSSTISFPTKHLKTRIHPQ